MRHAHFIFSFALVGATVLSGCRTDEQVAQNGTNNKASPTTTDRVADLTLPSGTSIDVTLDTRLTSETASVGDAWSGSTRNASVLDGRNIEPACVHFPK